MTKEEAREILEGHLIVSNVNFPITDEIAYKIWNEDGSTLEEFTFTHLLCIAYNLKTEKDMPYIPVPKPQNQQIEDKIVLRVLARFNERSQVGIKKYNTTLERSDLSTLEWLTHAQEEAMDFVLYLERLKDEFKTKQQEQ